MSKSRRHQTHVKVSEQTPRHQTTQDQTRGDPLLAARALRRGVLRNIFNPFMEPHDVIRQFTRPDSEIEDLRRWRPRQTHLPLPSPRQYFRQDGQVALQGRLPANHRGMSGLLSYLRLQFREPRQTHVCVRRQARRQVLFALRRAGRGSGAHKTPRWSAQSFIQCRRR